MEHKISAPVKKGQKLGEVSYVLNDEVVGKTNIIANDDVAKISLWNMTTHVYKNWYQLNRK